MLIVYSEISNSSKGATASISISPLPQWLLQFACHLLEKPSFNFRASYIKSFVSLHLEDKRNTSTLVISSALLTLALGEPNGVL